MDGLLFLLAIGVWVVAGSPRLSAIVHAGVNGTDLLWGLLYLGFLYALVRAMRSHDPRRKLNFTLLQSAFAIAILPTGMPHFEGALLSVVGAQTLLVTSPRWALAWVVGQAMPLFATILPSHDLLGAAKATGEYLAFSIFAMTAFALRERERRQRLALSRMQAELLGTQSLLRDTVAMAEQGRIRRELHDSLGHHLAVASSHLDAARLRSASEEDDGGRDHGAREHLDRARGALDALTAESRAVLGGMTPKIRLDEALETLVGALPGLIVEIDVEAFAEERPDVLWTVFRAVQEGVTNAHKHGRARTVRVFGRSDADGLRLTIENDGAAMPAPGAAPSGAPAAGAAPEGVGLRSMRERV
ncbi:MAG: histidine kinase, partial [Myxococcota bacterium]